METSTNLDLEIKYAIGAIPNYADYDFEIEYALAPIPNYANYNFQIDYNIQSPAKAYDLGIVYFLDGAPPAAMFFGSQL